MARKATQPVGDGYKQEDLYRGQFGFRNRAGRTGLDPWDVEMEMAHAEGTFLKGLITFRLRTKNPLAILLMIFADCVALLPFSLLIAEPLLQVPFNRTMLSYILDFSEPRFIILQLQCLGGLLILSAGGLLLLANIVLSIRDILNHRPEPDEDDPLDEEQPD